jgi:hypothetical protein
VVKGFLRTSGTNRGWSFAIILAVALAVALGTGAGPDAQAAARVLHVVVLGDSGASGNGDPTGLAWGGRASVVS